MPSRIELTGTQRTIVKMLGNGDELDVIASRLALPVADVEIVIKELYDRLGVTTHAGIVGKAITNRLVGVYCFSSTLPVPA